MKSSFCIDLQRFMLIPTKFPLSLVAISLGINTIASLVVSRNQEFAIMWAVFLQASFCALGTLAFMKKKDI